MNIDQAAELLLRLIPDVVQALEMGGVAPTEASALTGRQREVLKRLDTEKPLSLTELAAQLGVTPASASVAVERLVRKGLLTRRRAGVNRRKLEIRLTLKGQSAASFGGPFTLESAVRLAATMDSGERDQAVYGVWLLAEAATQLEKQSIPR